MRAQLVLTGHPLTVAVDGYTPQPAEDGSNERAYRFFAPWENWGSPGVVGPGGTLNYTLEGSISAAAGTAFETLVGNGFLLRVAEGESVGPTVGTVLPRDVDYGTLSPEFLARLPSGFLLGNLSYQYMPSPPQQPMEVAAFVTVIEVDEQATVSPQGEQVAGCCFSYGFHPADAVAVDGGQLLAVSSSYPIGSCPMDLRGALQPSCQTRIVRRTPPGVLEDKGAITGPPGDLYLIARADGAWLAIAGTDVQLVRLDASGAVVKGPLMLPRRNGNSGARWVGGASLGDRLVVAVNFDQGSALELLDDNGNLVDTVATPTLLGVVGSPNQDGVVATQVPATADGGRGDVQLARYDCPPLP
jgi:hypothetical protein